ncbi:hypothetical protein Q5762_16550 [Streptomyces sp. P9(2023)]|uniref:hypothetical protein n=1 Tax=Streptomyces sp. P9(2023) TaxID=3064394 RepID=UPI0028F40A4A|nr:hypothetical protein [Streptomyces sp. P9(2023)]MDT9689922.1 hypothetical protein [Streptomyces sp. P9(2023)]
MSESDEHPPPEHSPPEHAATPPARGSEPTSPTALLRIVIAQGTFIAALMFYLGAMYTSSFYAYFHISLSALDLGFGEQVTQSLHMLKLEVLVAAGVVLLLVAVPWYSARSWPNGAAAPRAPSRAEVLAGRLQLPVVAVGVVLLALWSEIQPYGWTAPLVIAAGLLMGQFRDATGRRPTAFRYRALPIFAAGVFLFWALTQVTVQTAERDAASRARHVTEWTGVMLLSTHPLALPTSRVTKDVLPSGVRHRYRYTGLRLLLERDGRYYVVPLGWNVKQDVMYIVRESDTVWIGLTPGTRPKLLG